MQEAQRGVEHAYSLGGGASDSWLAAQYGQGRRSLEELQAKNEHPKCVAEYELLTSTQTHKNVYTSGEVVGQVVVLSESGEHLGARATGGCLSTSTRVSYVVCSRPRDRLCNSVAK